MNLICFLMIRTNTITKEVAFTKSFVLSFLAAQLTLQLPWEPSPSEQKGCHCAVAIVSLIQIFKESFYLQLQLLQRLFFFLYWQMQELFMEFFEYLSHKMVMFIHAWVSSLCHISTVVCPGSVFLSGIGDCNLYAIGGNSWNLCDSFFLYLRIWNSAAI